MFNSQLLLKTTTYIVCKEPILIMTNNTVDTIVDTY